MEIWFEVIFGFLAELVLSVIGETIVEFGFHSLAESLSSKHWKRVLVGVLYVGGAFALGALSLQFFPLMVFGNRSIPVLYFVFSPIVAGLGLCLVSWIIDRGITDRPFFQLSKFLYGAIFALTFSLTRSMFG